MNIRKKVFKSILASAISLVITMQLIPAAVFAQDMPATIQIVYTNDTHGYYAASDRGNLGYAILTSIIEKEEADLVLDIGDTFHGQAFATAEQGKSIAELMKAAGYDAMTPGNHDFSYGAERLKELEETGGFKILASNIVTDSGEDYFESPYLIKEVTADNGEKLKVGVIGVIDDKFYNSTASENVFGLKFEEEAKEAAETAAYLKDSEKCDIVLAITHQSDCRGFVANIKGIDAVLAGHEHKIIDESYTDSDGKSVPVVEAGYYFNNIGVMELSFDADAKKVIDAENTVYSSENLADVKEDEAVKQKTAEIEERQQAILEEKIGYADAAYPYSWEDIRVSQQAIGKFVCESYLAETGADIAFENAGGIRAGLDEGEITYKEIISISPYGNVLVTKQLKGGDILDILNRSAEIGKACDSVYTLQKEAAEKGEDPYQYQWPENSGSYLQFGGIEIETDESGAVVSARVNGEKIDENKLYTVAANNYIADGGDYTALNTAALDKEYGTCEEALRSYVETNPIDSTKNFATRGEVVKMLLTAADDYNPNVQKSDIIKGYEDGLLHEERFVTRAEALVMLKRAFGELPKPVGHNKRVAFTSEDFTDIPEWAKSELENIFDAGIVAGTAKGIFSPDDNVTAEQMKLFISRVFTLFGTNEKDDFYAAVHKEYLDKHEMKPGRTIGGAIYDIRDEVLLQTEDIITDAVSGEHKEGTPERKIADFYSTVMDTEGRNKAGYEPIKPYLDRIDNAKSIDDLLKMQAAIKNETNCFPYFGFTLSDDMNDSTKHVLSFTTASPELDKDFYAGEDSEKKQIYLDYVKEKLSLVDDNGTVSPQQLYEFDKKLAAKQLAPEEYYDVDKTNNIFTFAQIQDMFPGVDMEAVLNASGFKKSDRILIYDTEMTKEYASLFTNENLEVLKTRGKLEIINDFGKLLSKDFTDARNRFEQSYLGVDGSYTDSELAVLAVQDNMSEYVGRIYAEKYFSPEEKAAVTKMAEDIIAVYRKRIQNLDWMSAATKEKAIRKLDTMTIKVGYPDDWSTPLDNAEIKSKENGGNYFKNQMAINKAWAEKQVAEQEKSVDKTQWVTAVYEVNAFYNPMSNDITFPAAFLQKPFYDPDKSYEYNLGSIGTVIGHEITHAFDNNGAKYDENGNAADWWTKEDYTAFQALCEKMAEFYDGYEYAPGIAINGWLTLSENVADQGAMSCILEIAKSLENPDYKELFYSYANIDLLTTSREYGEYLTGNDPHGLGRARLNPIAANFEEFYKAFDIDASDGMYIAPENRVKIW